MTMFLEDSGDSVFEIEMSGILHEIKHANHKRINQIKFFHAGQQNIDLIKRIIDLG